MKQKVFSRYKNSTIFVAAMLSSCLTFSATEQEEVQIRLSKVELQEIFNNPNHPYVYLLGQASDLAKVIDKISALDKDKESLIHGLNNHVKRGFAIAHYDAVAQTLERAEKILQEAQAELAVDEYQALKKSLEDVIDLVINDRLSLEADMLSFMKDAVDTEDMSRSRHCGLRLITVDEKFYFLSLVKFKNHVIFKDHVKFEEDVKFKDDVTFEDEVVFEDAVTIEGTLSVADEIVGCDLTVGCNILMTNSTDALHGNILKNGTQFIHNFGTQNTFMGAGAGNFTMTGTSNTGVGFNTLTANTTGNSNAAIGVNTLSSNTIGSTNVAIGTGALFANTAGNNNIAIGGAALLGNTTGNNNIAIGAQALFVNTTGNDNIAIGNATLSSNTIGIQNTAVGSNALRTNTTGANNSAFGTNTLVANTTGANNSAFGSFAMTSNTTGANNSAFGTNALVANITGQSNAAFGVNTMSANTIGTDNSAFGSAALSANTTGNANIAVGRSAGSLTTGNFNILIGHPGVAAENGAIRIGFLGNQGTCFIQGISGVVVAGGVPVIVDVAGQLGTIVSKRSAKKEIQSMGDMSARIYDLEPVTFVYRNDATNTPQVGLIADDVAQVLPELVQYGADGKPETVYYQHLSVYNLNELKRLAARVAALEAALADRR